MCTGNGTRDIGHIKKNTMTITNMAFINLLSIDMEKEGLILIVIILYKIANKIIVINALMNTVLIRIPKPRTNPNKIAFLLFLFSRNGHRK